MRFVHAWAYACSNYLMVQMKESHEKRRVYYYGFQIIIGGAVKLAFLILISLLLGSLIPTLLISLFFATLRVIAGGYHMNTYGKCMFTSLGLFLAAGLVTRYTHEFWSEGAMLGFAAFCFLAGLFVVYRWVPRDTPNRPITEPEEIRKFRRLSFIYMLLWGALTLYLSLNGSNMAALSASFGLLLELFTVTPAGYRFFDWVSGEVTRAAKQISG